MDEQNKAVNTENEAVPGEEAKTEEELKEEQKREEEQEEEEEDQKKNIKKKEKSVKKYQFFILRLLIFLIILWVLLFKVVGLTRMPNDDMYPRVDAGDLVLFYRLDKDVRAQDLIVIEKRLPNVEGDKQLWICRGIAAPGDTVEVGENRVIVNGNALVESNIFYPTGPYEGYDMPYPITLGEDEYFVLADKRDGGVDSRVFGVVSKKEDFVGTVITIFRRNNL